ncbi:hypothetical protein ACFWA9_10045 [Kitasatospora sp. NPDC059973]|uniref:hypothetical protein n=1 Tax=Kitasatospora sp. NPDC059973 TaxID=3347020 RepID=UPI0036AB1A01
MVAILFDMATNRSRTAGTRQETPFGLTLSRTHIEPAGWLLTLSMEPRTPAGELDDLSGLGWPLWTDTLQRDPRWVVSFDARTRRLVRIVRLNDAQTAVQNNLFALGDGIPLDERLWPTVEGERPVILCGPLRGEPTTEAMDAAKAAGTLRGIAARCLIS